MANRESNEIEVSGNKMTVQNMNKVNSDGSITNTGFSLIESQAELHFKIVDFLNECEEQDWELDSDDIRHILKLDFDYVRKSNTEDKKWIM